MKKVNFFIGTLSTGGAERVVSNISINLNEKMGKTILMFGKESKVAYPYRGEIRYLDKMEHTNIFKKIKAFYTRIKSIKTIKKADPNTTTISFLEYPNLINLITSKSGKTVVSVRNHMSTKHKKGMKAQFWNNSVKYLYPRADLIISVSEEIKKDLVINYNIDSSKIKVIYNSYDIDGIRQSAQEELESKYKEIFKHPVIITVGRLNKQKGHWHLIRAFSKVKKEIPDVKLVILGEGELEPYLKQLTSDLNLDEDVFFLGFQENPFKYISQSKMFIMSSFYEGFPNALAEAMACGIPVLSSDCLSGPREILAPAEFNDFHNINYTLNNDRYGILLPVCDGNRYCSNDSLTEEELVMSDAMESILKSQELYTYFANKSLERIEDFEISNIIKDWDNII